MESDHRGQAKGNREGDIKCNLDNRQIRVKVKDNQCNIHNLNLDKYRKDSPDLVNIIHHFSRLNPNPNLSQVRTGCNMPNRRILWLGMGVWDRRT